MKDLNMHLKWYKITMIFCLIGLMTGASYATLHYPSFDSVSDGAKWCIDLRAEEKLETRVPYPSFSNASGASSWCQTFCSQSKLFGKIRYPNFSDVNGFCVWCQAYYFAVNHNVFL